MDTQLTTLRQQVSQRLLSLCSAERTKASAIHPAYGRLWETISQQIASGGKYLRPYLVQLSYEAYGGTDDIIDVAAAWELLHIGLLLHDDIIDRDFTRHGQPNVAGRYRELYGADHEHHAQSAALLAGDLVLAAARRLLPNPQLIKIYDDALATVIAGELLDMEASLVSDPASPQLIAETKTASYSCIGPLLTGATLADAPNSQLKILGELGRLLGVGFQLADDLLIFGSEAGKDVASDLREGKRTMVVAEALNLLPKAERHKIELTLLTNPQANVANMPHLFERTGVETVLRKKLSEYESQAGTLIDQLQIPTNYQEKFKTMAHDMFFRTT
jgi:geranylgeranyl diphosphate synthase type II